MGEGQTAAAAELERLVWEELRQCFDPEIPVNIVDLGLVYAVHAVPFSDGDHRVEVVMTVTSPGCAMAEILHDEIEDRLRRLPGAREVEVEVTFDPPWTPDRMTADARAALNL